MNKFMAYFASVVSLIAGVAFCVPVCAQEKATQTMTLSTLFDLARPLPSMRHPRRPHKHPESPPLVSLRHRLSSEEKVKKSKL